MEHRYATRIPLQLSVLIYRQGLPVQAGRTRDISMEGAFVETRYMKCRKHDCLDVEFLQTGPDGCERFRVKALVVRRDKDGIGFEFAALEAKSEQALRDCIRQLQVDSRYQPPSVVGFR